MQKKIVLSKKKTIVTHNSQNKRTANIRVKFTIVLLKVQNEDHSTHIKLQLLTKADSFPPRYEF